MTPPHDTTAVPAPPATNGTGAASPNGTPEAPAQPSYASGARVLSIGIASTGIFTFLYLAPREPLARPRLLQPYLAVLGDHVRDPVGDLPPDRAAALADDRRPARAWFARPSAADPGPDPVQLRDAVPDRRARAAIGDRAGRLRRLDRAVLDPRDRRARLRRAATSRAAGSPATSGSRCTAGSCSSNRPRRFLFALAVAVGIASGQARGRARHGGGAVRVAVRDPVRVLAAAAQAPRPAYRVADAAREGPAHAEIEEAAADLSFKGGRVRGVGRRDHARRADADERRRADRRRQRREQGGADRRHHRVRVQRAADRAGAATAVPGDPDLDPPPSGDPRGTRVGRGVPSGDQDHDQGDRSVRGRGGASGCSRSARS